MLENEEDWKLGIQLKSEKEPHSKTEESKEGIIKIITEMKEIFLKQQMGSNLVIWKNKIDKYHVGFDEKNRADKKL